MAPSFSLPFLQTTPDSPPRNQREKQLASRWWSGIQKQRQKSVGEGSNGDDERKQSLAMLCKGCWCHGCAAESHGRENCNCLSPERERTPARRPPNAPLTPPPSLESLDERNMSISKAGETSKKLQKATPRQVHFLPAPKPIKPITQALLPSPALAESDTAVSFNNNFSFNFQNPRANDAKEEAIPPSYNDPVEKYSHGTPDISSEIKHAERKESAPAILQKANTPVRQPKWNVFPHGSAGQNDRRGSTTEAKWLAGTLKSCESWLKQVPNSRSQRNFSIVELSSQSPTEVTTMVAEDAISEELQESTPSSSLPYSEGSKPRQSSASLANVPQTPDQKSSGPAISSHFSPDTPPRSPDRPQRPGPDEAQPRTPPPSVSLNRLKTPTVHSRSLTSPPRAVPVRFKRRGHSRSASGLARSQNVEPLSPLPQLEPPQRSFSVDETSSKIRRKLGISSNGVKQFAPPKSAMRRRGHEAPPSSPPSRRGSQPQLNSHSRHSSSASGTISPSSTSPVNVDSSALLDRCTILEPVLFHLQSTLQSFPALTLRLEDPIIRRLRSMNSSNTAHIATLGRVFAHAPPPLLSALAASTIAESFLKACFSAADFSGHSPGNRKAMIQSQSDLDCFVARLRATEDSPSPGATITSTSSTGVPSATTGAAVVNDSTPDLTTFNPPPGHLLNLTLPDPEDAAAYARALAGRARVLCSSLDGVIGALLEAVCGGSGDLVCRRFLGVLVDVVEGKADA
ncbi:MAG: hypothetical protein Q9160_006339 [Pyrenula sp. 1 TL-2023]